MIQLKEFLNEKTYDNYILTESCNIIGDMIITESFDSKLLSRLASQVYKYQGDAREYDKNNAERYAKEGWGKPRPTAETFASLFGPYMAKPKYKYGESQKVRGLKWNKIKDSDFVKYDGFDADLHKYIKKMFQKKMSGIAIVCNSKDDIVYVIRGYNGENEKPVVFMFNDYIDYNKNTRKKITRMTSTKNKYQSRDYNLEETLELINDYSVYFLEITNNMMEEYNILANDRKNVQKGIVNYDEKSLKQLAARQQASYKALAKELREKRLAEDPMKLFDEITTVNNDVLKLYQEIISEPEYLDKYFNIGDLMDYVKYAFDRFYTYVRQIREADKDNENAQKNLAADPDNEDLKKYAQRAGKYRRENAKSYLEEAKSYLNRVKKNMGEIRKTMDDK